MGLCRKAAVLLVLAMILFVVPCPAEEGGGEVRILMLETTDIHGYIVDASSGKPESFQHRMACIAHDVGEARSSGLYDDVILLDGGDLYQGTPVSNLTGGATVRAVVDRLKYDAVVLGNHEFDWDVTEYAADSRGTVPPYELGDRFGDPDVPVLASNLYDAGSGQRVPFTKDYVILEKAGKRIAVIGYIPDYHRDIMVSKIAPYRIDGSLERLDGLVRRVSAEERPDAVIILAHEGPETVAAAMDPSLVALVAGGHTHQVSVGTAANGIPFIQGRCYAQGYASAVLVIGPQGCSVEDARYTSIMEDRSLLLATEENAPHLDSEIMEMANAAWDAVSDRMGEVLGYIDKPVVSEWSAVGASSAGNWFTGLMLRATRPYGTVAAFYNTGGIRADFTLPAGAETRTVTAYDVYSIAPFCNSWLVFEITGAELKQQLVNGLGHPNQGDQLSGLTFTYTATGNPDTPRDKREYTILSITLSDGTPVDPEDTATLYRVCTSDYNATQPGSVFEGKEPVVPAAESPIDNEIMITLLREEGQANGGYLAVDDGPRGIEVEEGQEPARETEEPGAA